MEQVYVESAKTGIIYVTDLPIYEYLSFIYHHLTKMLSKKEKPASNISEADFGAVGESRTHTPQRALPPQSSVSTISPLPHGLGLQIYGEFLKTQIFY